MPWLFVISSVILGVAGQLLMKKGMMIVGSIQLFPFTEVFKAVMNPFVFSGFLSYAISSVLWLVAISKLPLSNAYPVLSAGYVIVVFASFFFFNESITVFKILGVILICAGVIFISRS